jgi:hypothetical protein
VIPLGVISHLHRPIVRLQVQRAMPFCIMQQLTMPPAIMVQRFCIMVQAALSSHVHMIFSPSVHVSIFIVQRGIMSHCAPVGVLMGVVMPAEAIAGMFIPVRSIIMLVITRLLLNVNSIANPAREDYRRDRPIVASVKLGKIYICEEILLILPAPPKRRKMTEVTGII